MWVIVGLGNPGSKYSRTRHNIGFRVVDRLSEEYGISLKEYDIYIWGRGLAGGRELALIKPLTFMNRSGIAVKKILRKLNIRKDDSPESLRDCLIVVHDDLDIDVGAIKIRRNGSSGGHRGIESIIEETGTKDFIRVKIGIGRDKDIPAEEYVLNTFKSSEKKMVSEAVDNAAGAVSVIVTEGVDRAMNMFNRPAAANDGQVE